MEDITRRSFVGMGMGAAAAVAAGSLISSVAQAEEAADAVDPALVFELEDPCEDGGEIRID